MNKVEYIDNDGILEDVWRQEREARQRRGQNHYRNRCYSSVMFKGTLMQI